MSAAPPVRKTEIDKFQIMWRARSVFSYHRIAFILNDRNQQKKKRGGGGKCDFIIVFIARVTSTAIGID